MAAPGSPRAPITDGVDRNFFAKLAISNTEFGDADGYSNVIFAFRGATKTIFLTNEGANPIEYSFNGNTLHGDLTTGTNTEHLEFLNRPASKIWFRVPSGGSTIRVEAWAMT